MLEDLYSISSDFIRKYGTKSIIDGEYAFTKRNKSFVKYFSSFKNSIYTNLHIYDDNSKYLLYIEPNIKDKLVEPINDEMVQIMELALSKAKTGTANSERKGYLN